MRPDPSRRLGREPRPQESCHATRRCDDCLDPDPHPFVTGGDGAQIVPARYDAVKIYRDRFVFVGLGGKTGLLDRRGRMVVPIQFDSRIIRILDSMVWIDRSRGVDSLYELDGRQILVPVQWG